MMLRTIPERFTVLQVLKDTRELLTFRAIDHVLERENVIVKITKKGCYKHDRQRLAQIVSWFRGVQHSQLVSIWEVGFTPKHDLLLVRENIMPIEVWSELSIE